MTYTLDNEIPDPPDPASTWARHRAEVAERFRGLVGEELDRWLEEQVKEGG